MKQMRQPALGRKAGVVGAVRRGSEVAGLKFSQVLSGSHTALASSESEWGKGFCEGAKGGLSGWLLRAQALGWVHLEKTH